MWSLAAAVRLIVAMDLSTAWPLLALPLLVLLQVHRLPVASSSTLGASDGLHVHLPVLPLGPEVNFSLASWTSTWTVQERSATVEWALPSFTKSAELHVLPSLLSPELSRAIIKQLPQQVNTDPDSVDSLPTFEFPIESFQQPNLLDTDGEAGQARAALREITAAPIADSILPYVRAKYKCPGCKVCTSMLRRYLPDERRRHPAHFDTQAYITVVVSLSAFGEDFSGGLYVRRGGSGPGGVGESGDAYLPLGLGDAVSHQFDIEHGVELVGSGERYSWILWLQDGDVCAAGGKASWHEEAASSGDPVAMYNLGNTMTSDPMDGEAVARAHDWFVRAAEGGYAAAMYSAGVMHVQGPPTVEQNPAKGLAWLEKAAALGDLHAKYNTGFMLTQGVGGEARRQEGLAWFEQAAVDGDAKSAFALAAMYLGQGEAFGKRTALGVCLNLHPVNLTHQVCVCDTTWLRACKR